MEVSQYSREHSKGCTRVPMPCAGQQPAAGRQLTRLCARLGQCGGRAAAQITNSLQQRVHVHWVAGARRCLWTAIWGGVSVHRDTARGPWVFGPSATGRCFSNTHGVMGRTRAPSEWWPASPACSQNKNGTTINARAGAQTSSQMKMDRRRYTKLKRVNSL